LSQYLTKYHDMMTSTA